MRELVEGAASSVFDYVKSFDPGTISGSWVIVIAAVAAVVGILMLIRLAFPIRASLEAGNSARATEASNILVEENA